MSLLGALVSRLNESTTFTAVAGTTRQFKAIPGVVLQIVAAVRDEHYKGDQPGETTVQLDIWAADAAAGAGLREAAIAVLRPAAEAGGIRFRRARVLNIRSGVEQGQGPQEAGPNARRAPELHRESIDFLFIHTPA